MVTLRPREIFIFSPNSFAYGNRLAAEYPLDFTNIIFEATVTSKYVCVISSDSEDNIDVINLCSDDEEDDQAAANKALERPVGKGPISVSASHRSSPIVAGNGMEKVDMNFAQGKAEMDADSSTKMKRKFNGPPTGEKKLLLIPDCSNSSFQQCSSQSSSSPIKFWGRKLP